MLTKNKKSRLLRSLNNPEHSIMHPSIRPALWLCIFTFIVFVVWASIFEIDEVTHGQGRVVPSSRLQLIQSLEGGILDTLLVSEGAMVEPNQVLATLDNTRFYSDYMEGLTQSNALRATIARLNAEVKNLDKIDFPEEINDEEIDTELDLFNARRNKKQQTIDAIKDEISILQQELKVLLPLVKKRSVSQMEVLKVKKSIASLNSKIIDVQSSYIQDAYSELTKKKSDLSVLQTTLLQKKDQLKRTKITSPVKGQVNDILVTTKGGVIKPGEPIMKILPLDDQLLLETKISPKDVAFLYPGMKANVRITAYDYTIYGSLVGTIEQISADTLEEDTAKGKEYYYQVLVSTNKNYLEKDGAMLPIKPGMLAQVDILGGKKTIMSYLLKPLIKSKLY